ncbi:MAG: hypothetical protein AB8G23_07035 [Myxococcota bacterium]
MTALTFGLALLGTIAIFLTTTRGREVAKRIGLRDRVSGAAKSDDVAYFLSACGGDRDEVSRRIAAERERFPDLTEAEHYRRAIRRVMADSKA